MTDDHTHEHDHDGHAQAVDDEVRFLDLTEPGVGRRIRDVTVQRVRRHEEFPNAPTGLPGERHEVIVVGIEQTLLGVLFGYEVASVPLCQHGEFPDLKFMGRGGQGRVWQYCPDCGVYMLAALFPGHRRNPSWART